MSVARRVLPLIVLALVAATAAALVNHQRSLDDDVRRAAAFTRAGHALDALRSGRDAAEVAVGLGTGAVGTCTRAGISHLTLSGPQIPGDGLGDVDNRPPPPPPSHDRDDGLLWLDRDAVVRACRDRATNQRTPSSAVAPGDLLVVVVDDDGQAEARWALVRLPRRPRDNTALLALVATALGLTLVAAFTAFALRRLRASAHELTAALDTLAHDLSAPVPRPRAAELLDVSDGIQRLATSLKQAGDIERELRDAVAHGERLASLGRVIAGVAHEVRNPLAGIKLTLEGMHRRNTDARLAADVSLCLAEIARLDSVVDDLLLAARAKPVDASESKDLDLAALVDERLALLQPYAASREVLLIRTGEARAHGHRDSLVRVVDNLVKNAIEASPKQAVVTVVLDDSGFSVIDGGVGVDGDAASHLFEPFFTQRKGGTGLGLFLSRALVQAHGGEIDYHRDGSLTVFRVRFRPTSTTN